LIAVVLAIGASELVLNRVHLRPAEWLSADDEPRRQLDRDLAGRGYGSDGHKSIGGRIIDLLHRSRGIFASTVLTSQSIRSDQRSCLPVSLFMFW